MYAKGNIIRSQEKKGEISGGVELNAFKEGPASSPEATNRRER